MSAIMSESSVLVPESVRVSMIVRTIRPQACIRVEMKDDFNQVIMRYDGNKEKMIHDWNQCIEKKMGKRSRIIDIQPGSTNALVATDEDDTTSWLNAKSTKDIGLPSDLTLVKTRLDIHATTLLNRPSTNQLSQLPTHYPFCSIEQHLSASVSTLPPIASSSNSLFSSQFRSHQTQENSTYKRTNSVHKDPSSHRHLIPAGESHTDTPIESVSTSSKPTDRTSYVDLPSWYMSPRQCDELASQLKLKRLRDPYPAIGDLIDGTADWTVDETESVSGDEESDGDDVDSEDVKGTVARATDSISIVN